MQLRTVRATQYVTALREGGSLPAIVAGDDLGMYVVKFRGAGQGPLVLVAELIAGEIGRALGLNVPELVFVEVDSALGRNEPDQEIRELLKASTGLNLALDYLPGSTMFDPAAGDKADPRTASLAVWFDAFVMNVDRTPRNANLLVWHKELYFIDHGAAIYVQHDWESMPERATSPFRDAKNHILLPWATALEEADRHARTVITRDLLSDILEAVPDHWLTAPRSTPSTNAGAEGEGISAAQKRAAYLDFFTRRLAASSIFVKEAGDARHQLV